MLHLVAFFFSVNWILVNALFYFSCTFVNVLSCFHVCIDCKNTLLCGGNKEYLHISTYRIGERRNLVTKIISGFGYFTSHPWYGFGRTFLLGKVDRSAHTFRVFASLQSFERLIFPLYGPIVCIEMSKMIVLIL